MWNCAVNAQAVSLSHFSMLQKLNPILRVLLHGWLVICCAEVCILLNFRQPNSIVAVFAVSRQWSSSLERAIYLQACLLFKHFNHSSTCVNHWLHWLLASAHWILFDLLQHLLALKKHRLFAQTLLALLEVLNHGSTRLSQGWPSPSRVIHRELDVAVAYALFNLHFEIPLLIQISWFVVTVVALLLSQFKAIHVVVEAAQVNLIFLLIRRLFELRSKVGLNLLLLLWACDKT